MLLAYHLGVSLPFRLIVAAEHCVLQIPCNRNGLQRLKRLDQMKYSPHLPDKERPDDTFVI